MINNQFLFSDEKLEEDFLLMEPYYKLWIIEYHKTINSFDTILNKYEVDMDALGFKMYESIASSHMYSIFNMFREIIMSYCYSVAAEKVENQLRMDSMDGWADNWKYYKKIYFIRPLFSDIFSLLEYVAFMINKISGEKFSSQDHISFKTLENKIHGINKGIKNFSLEDIHHIKKFINLVYKNLDDNDKIYLFGDIRKKNWDTRHKYIHRYFLGIDELSAIGHKRILTEKEKKLYGAKLDIAYGFSGKPEYKYEQCRKTIFKMITNIDKAFYELCKIDMIKGIIVEI